MVEGGTAHGWERSTDQLVSLEVPPAPVYKGARGEVAGLGGGRAKGGSPTPTGSRTPPSLVGVGEKERGGEEEGKGGCTPCPIRTRGGRVPPSFWPLSSIPVWPNKAHILPGEFP